MRPPRLAAGALLLLYVLAHLVFLPRTLEDLDSINFALGVREFDVARHQPHPPGYPVFVALGKLSTAAFRAMGVAAAAPRGLAFWSATAALAALPALFLFFGALERRERLAWWATVVTAVSPLYWFTALRPLSDMTGFACAIGAQALMLQRRPRALAAGALLAGLAIGVRSQTAALTFPLLAFVLLTRDDALPLRSRLTALGAAAAGALAWGIPLLLVSGGLRAYLEALGSQAGEDLGGGVVMLWTHRSPRVALAALQNTFVWPWDWWPGIGMCVLAAAGLLRIAWRMPRAVVLLLVAFVPYAIFHLLFHETQTVRYALPLVPIVAYAAVAALETRRPLPIAAAATLVALVSLGLALPASRTYAREGAPVFRAFDDMAATAHGGEPVDTIAMHAGARRAAEWAAPILPARVAKAPHGREWLTLVALWRARPAAAVWFVADPRRTDLALFDGRARSLARQYRWGFIEPPFVGGARPGPVDWYHMRPPGWMLDRGWSLTAEVGGVTARDRLGPHVEPAVAWVKGRREEALLLIGGRNLGGGSAVSTVQVTLNGRPLASWAVAPGFFVRRGAIPAGTLAPATGYAALEVTALAKPSVPVSLEQFDLQGPAVPMFAYEEGWQEPEYNPALGAAWRWMSERSVLWVRPIGRAVKLTLHGESPLRYYDAAPHVRIRIGDREVASLDPSSDFEETFELPADLLQSGDGRVTLESSRFFVPGGASGGDQRHLALRIWSVSVE